MRKLHTIRDKWLVYSFAFVACFSTSILLACQVPVFRYALERWNPEPYPVVIITSAEASETERNGLQSVGSEQIATHMRIDWKSATDSLPPELLQLWKKNASDKGVVAIYYPEKSELRGTIAYTTPLKPDALSAIVTSPARKEIASRLSAGESAVWVLLESGDKAKDTAARQAIESQLALDEEWLKLPSAEEMEIKPEVLDNVRIKLRVDFSVLSVSRADPKEEFLVQCLLNSEEDLQLFDDPIAFPVFGRGLVLYALVGKGINGDTIRSASKFICGPCSCQVKEQNPGFDLLLAHPWDQTVGDVFISQPIPGTGAQPKLLKIPPGRKK
jgi:hypothetical protein